MSAIVYFGGFATIEIALSWPDYLGGPGPLSP